MPRSTIKLVYPPLADRRADPTVVRSPFSQGDDLPQSLETVERRHKLSTLQGGLRQVRE